MYTTDIDNYSLPSNESQPSVLDWEHPDPIPDDSETNFPSNIGLDFDFDASSYRPTRSHSQNPIPRELTDSMMEFVRRRQQICFNAESINEYGHFNGHMLLPSDDGTCSVCGKNWNMAAVTNSLKKFILRTLNGSMLQDIGFLICDCNNKKLWDPADEAIHTIDDDSEGGTLNFSFLLFSKNSKCYY